MVKRLLVNIMLNFAPVFIVVCVLLCFSFSCTFPVHRARSKDLTELFNRSPKCVSAHRAKKMTPDNLVIGPQDFSESGNAEPAKRKLSGEDLRQYEQLVIMKKYPYLDLKEFEVKFGPSVKNAKYRDAEVAEASECRLTEDDGPRVEIFSRGISGFAIPKSPSMAVKAAQGERRVVEHKDVNLRQNLRILRLWDNLKAFASND